MSVGARKHGNTDPSIVEWGSPVWSVLDVAKQQSAASAGTGKSTIAPAAAEKERKFPELFYEDDFRQDLPFMEDRRETANPAVVDGSEKAAEKSRPPDFLQRLAEKSSFGGGGGAAAAAAVAAAAPKQTVGKSPAQRAPPKTTTTTTTTTNKKEAEADEPPPLVPDSDGESSEDGAEPAAEADEAQVNDLAQRLSKILGWEQAHFREKLGKAGLTFQMLMESMSICAQVGHYCYFFLCCVFLLFLLSSQGHDLPR